MLQLFPTLYRETKYPRVCPEAMTVLYCISCQLSECENIPTIDPEFYCTEGYIVRKYDLNIG